MSKYKKYILITLFSLLMLFGFGGEVKAGFHTMCPFAPDGYKYVIFAMTRDYDRDGNWDFNDDEESWGACILVKKNQTDIGYEELVDVGLLNISDADNEVNQQHYVMGSVGIKPWNDETFIDKYVAQMRFKLRMYMDTNAHEADNEKYRIRYRIQQDGGGFFYDVYLYCVGEAEVDENMRLVIPKETCWKATQADCEKKYTNECFWHPIPNIHNCQSRFDPAICEKLPINLCGTKVGSQACQWNTVKKECLTILKESIEQAYPVPAGYNGPMPPCAFSGSCHDTNDIVQLVVNFVANILLPFVGGAVFIMFVYGGFTIILSFGNPEKVKKGWGILIAALVGMGIVFGAYLLLDFVFTSLNISAGFRGFGR